MARILVPIVLLTMLLPSHAYGQTFDALVKREGIYYLQFSTTPFTGETQGRIQATFKNGQRDGPWTSFYSNGQLFEKGNFRGGEEHGVWVSYHANGRLASKGSYKNGKEDGLWLVFDMTGNLHESISGNYKNGIKVSD